MKILLEFLGGVVEWFFSILWFPVHLRNYLQARSAAAIAQAQSSRAQQVAANAQAMAVLWQMGSDFKPLARHIAMSLHEAYGVEPSAVAPGTLIPIRPRAEEEN